MSIAAVVTMRAVLRQFLADEAAKTEYAAALSDLDSWTELPDEAFIRQVQEFAKSRYDVNPVLTYTIGTLANRHHERVLGWRLETIPLAELYTCGLTTDLQHDLDAVQGNLVAFAQQHAAKYAEFRLTETPALELQRVIAVRHRTKRCRGTIQLLDGAHRVVALAVQGATTITGYVGKVKRWTL